MWRKDTRGIGAHDLGRLTTREYCTRCACRMQEGASEKSERAATPRSIASALLRLSSRN